MKATTASLATVLFMLSSFSLGTALRCYQCDHSSLMPDNDSTNQRACTDEAFSADQLKIADTSTLTTIYLPDVRCFVQHISIDDIQLVSRGYVVDANQLQELSGVVYTCTTHLCNGFGSTDQNNGNGSATLAVPVLVVLGAALLSVLVATCE